MSTLNEKEEFLRSMLQENINLSMKEANRVIREKFETGVAPPLYSKVRKSLLEEMEQQEEDQTEESQVEEKVEEEDDLSDLISFSAPTPNMTPAAEDFFSTPDEESTEATVDTTPATPEPEAPKAAPAPQPLSGKLHPVDLSIKIHYAEQVHLAGSFNEWRKNEYQLERHGNEWKFQGQLPEGVHHFKYIIDNTSWHIDFDRELITDNTGLSNKITVPESSEA